MTYMKYQDVWQLFSKYDLQIDLHQDLDLICVICKKLLKNPYQSSCGCRYCFSCIENYLRAGDRICPRQVDDCKDQMINMDRDLHVDHVACRRILKLPVNCPEKCCQFTDELRSIAAHLECHRIKCPYFDMGCSNRIGGPVDAINDHLRTDGHAHAVMLVDSIDHLKNEMAAMTDQFNTVVSELRNEISQLQFANASQFDTIAMLERRCSANDDVIADMASLRDDMRLGAHCGRLSDPVEEMPKELSYMQIKEICDDEDVKVIWKEQELIRTGIFELSRKQSEILMKLNKKIDENDEVIEFPDDSLLVQEELVEEDLPMESFGIFHDFAPFRWEINNFRQMGINARHGINASVMSKPFYSHMNGYKMRLVLYPDGIGTGKHVYLSIFFHIMRGDYDGQLRWPMSRAVTIELVDQKTNAAFLCTKYKHSAFGVDKQFAFHRPTTEMNIGCGSFRFVKINVAFNNGRIISNDRIVFRCSTSD